LHIDLFLYAPENAPTDYALQLTTAA